MDGKISVIIPFYNSETTLERCLDSVLTQTILNMESCTLEVILVDDGSSDSSFQIANRYIGTERLNFQLYSITENHGPSFARNVALSHATGDYVFFLDSDDEIQPTTLEKMLRSAFEYDSDLVLCGRIGVNSHTGQVIKKQIPKYEVLRGTIWENPDIVKRTGNLLCDKLLKRDIIVQHNLSFCEDYRHAEDFLFLSQYRTYMRTASAVQEGLYYYYMGNESSVSGSNDYVLDIPKVCQIVIDSYQTKRVFTQTKQQLLFIFLGFYLRKCEVIKNNSEIFNEFRAEFISIFNSYFKNDWKKMFLQRSISKFGKKKGKKFYKEYSKQIAEHACIQSKKTESFETGNQPLFSVIMPIYNSEDYLEESINSLINQSIGFKNIQLIFVNDGSTDKSEEICLSYCKRYPDNIVYVYQSNAGVASARNMGLKYIKGKYINFLDPDDLWSEDALEEALAFFQSHTDVPLVAARLKYFGARSGNHPLNYKFVRQRVIDITKQPGYPQLSASSSFIRSEALGETKYKGLLKIGEDTLFVNSIIGKYKKYGVLQKPVYWYRKRVAGDSALDISTNRLDFYFNTPEQCFQSLLNRSTDVTKSYFQYVAMYDLQWRIKMADSGYLSRQQKNEYKVLLQSLLHEIDDEVIINQRYITTDQKIVVFALKYNKTYNEVLDFGSDLSPTIAFWLSYLECSADLKFLSITSNQKLHIEGDIAVLSMGSNPHVCLQVSYFNGDKCEYQAKSVSLPERKKKSSFFIESYDPCLMFKSDIPVNDGIEDLELFVCSENGNRQTIQDIKFGKFVKLSNKLRLSCFSDKNYCIAYSQNSGLQVINQSDREAHKLRRRFLNALRSTSKGKKLLIYYFAATLCKKILNKNIWLISDRIIAAGDNGQALFEYLSNKRDKTFIPVFCISKQSRDYKKMKKTGHVVPYGSWRYHCLFLMADEVISSAGEEYVINAFGKNRDIAKCFYHFNFTFLQHGITKDDLSGWLCRENKNIALFVTSAVREAESIVKNNNYGYSSNVIKLTGFPRHDKLLADYSSGNVEKVILVMPTWRKNLAGQFVESLGQRMPNPDFTKSLYYYFYNSLLSNESLLNLMREKGYKLKFVIHPSFLQEAKKFKGNELSEVVDYFVDYTTEFRQASMLVTDYSSVAFDFALLNKPIIYAQFDKDTFFEGHSYKKGYFDYERDGFGPVCSSLDELVEIIGNYVLDDCAISECYMQRIKTFFGDQPSCRSEEVVKNILALR